MKNRLFNLYGGICLLRTLLVKIRTSGNFILSHYFSAESRYNRLSVNARSIFYIKYILSALIAILFFENINAQTTKPDVFLSQIEMIPSGGQVYDEFYWLNSNNASLTKTGVN